MAGVTSQSEVAEPLSQIAMKVLRDKTARVFRDAIIRVITKALTTKGMEAAGNKVGGGDGEKGQGNWLGALAKTATSVTMQATEEADKRAWITLPSRIEVARALVPPGTYDVSLQLARGGMAQPIRGVKVEAGKRVFLTHYSIP